MELVFFIVSIILLLLISIFLKQTRDEIREFRRRVFFNNGVPVRVKEGVKNDMSSPLYVQEVVRSRSTSSTDIQNVRVTNMPDEIHPMQCELKNSYGGIDVNFTNDSININQVYGIVETKKYVPDVF